MPALQALGIHDGATVIIYDDFLKMWATRLWWMLRAIGFTNAAVLNGSLKAWIAAAELVDSDEATPALATKPLFPNPRTSFVGLEAVRAFVAGLHEGEALVCALPESYYKGVDKVSGRGGHIPGSVNILTTSLLHSEAGSCRSKR